MADAAGLNLGDRRREYARAALDVDHVADEPLEQFRRWFADAEAADVLEPNAMTLATATATGAPSARIVLLKGLTADGFVFYTDYRSRKARELDANPAAALVFHWGVLERQVRVVGQVTRVDRAVAMAYFRSRPVGSRLGAWASHQSAPLASRTDLEARVQEVTARFGGGDVPLPDHWGGYALTPDEVEFWQGRPDRLHDRLLYTRLPEHAWRRERLSP